MAHNLYKSTMAFTGTLPWHKLGVALDKPFTAEEAIKQAKLDYKVTSEPIVRNGKKVLDRFFTVNGDTDDVLGIVGQRYEIIQNKNAFEFFDEVVGDKRAIYHTAGALGLGERIWMMAKLPKDMCIAKEDLVNKFLCLTNSHDGSSTLKCFFTPIRVVCQNTLTLALRQTESMVSIRHVGSLDAKVKEARRILGLAINFYDEVEDDFKAMAGTKVKSEENALDYLDRVMDISEKEEDEGISSKKFNARTRMMELFHKGKGNDAPAVRGTVWALYNGVTEFTDYEATVKGFKDNPSNRLDAIWFGSGSRMKKRAFEEAMVLVKK